MLYQIQITHSAEQDILAIYHYISAQLLELEYAHNQIARIEKAIYSLETLPKRFSILNIDDFATLGIRKLSVDNYLVFYQIKDDVVFILRVLYAKREWLTLL